MDAQTIALDRFGLGARPDERCRPIPRPGSAPSWAASTRARRHRRGADAAAKSRPSSPNISSRCSAMGGKAARQAPASAARPAPAGIDDRNARVRRWRRQPAARRRTTSSPVSPRRCSNSSARRVRDYYLASVGARTDAALTTAGAVRRAAGPFLGQPFRGLGRQAAGDRPCRPARIRGDPPARARQVRGHAARGRAASGDAALSRPGPVGRPRIAGRRARRGARPQELGLNENLAREIMELHTLGVRSGYSQADVTEFARALTGWTVDGLGAARRARLLGSAARPAASLRRAIHEPGDAHDPRQELRPAGRGAGAGGAARSCRQPGDRASISRPSSPAISPPTIRRPLWSTG